MPVAFVQAPAAGATNNASATSIALAYGSANTAGNFLALGVGWSGSLANGPSSVTDTAGNSNWAIITGTYDSVNGQGAAIAYCKNCNGGANTVTLNFAAAQSFRRLTIGEWSGVDTTAPLDKNAGSAPNTNTTTPSSGSVTTTTGGQLIVGVTQNDGGGALTFTPGSGFTTRGTVTSEMCLEDQVQVSAGAIAATWTTSVASTWVSVIATFKAAAAGGVSLPEIVLPPRRP